MSVHEREEARAIPGEAVRRRYVARKAFGRRVLSHYLGAAPERISFAKTALGKPGLSLAMQRGGLQFSASSSGPLAVFAVARDLSVGLDIESVRRSAGFSAIADWLDQTFGTEPADTDDVPVCRRWTQLEARAKCTGDGVALHQSGDDGWYLRSTMQHRAGERFVLTLATRRAPARVEGPFMLGSSSAGTRMPRMRTRPMPALAVA